MLDMEGSDAAVALILYGFGGVGKSTLAASLIQGLNLTSTEFKFSKVIIDENMADKVSHIMELQRCIIRDLGGGKIHLQTPEEGRNELRKVFQNKYCFLYMDNVADIDYVTQLLPNQLSIGRQSQLAQEQKQMQKLRIVITSRQGNLKPVLDSSCTYKEYPVTVLSADAAKFLLRKTILGSEDELHNHFDEESLMDQVAEACRGVPLLLRLFGNHLRCERDSRNYQDAVQALQVGSFADYSYGGEEQLGQRLWFVYSKMTDKEAQEAFLDICTYFNGWPWDIVSHIVGRKKLDLLRERMLVTRNNSDDKVIVHDILRLMGMEEARGSRITTYEQFCEALQDESNLKNVKGIFIQVGESIQSRHLDAMHSSLRILIIGDGVRVDGPPCERYFRSLRYLQLGNIPEFPFKDACQLEKLTGFKNMSYPGIKLPLLPHTLKFICHDLRGLSCFELARLPLQNLSSLENFTVEMEESTRLPEGLNLPASLLTLHFSCCYRVPERLSHLTALQSVTLEKCNWKVLPREFGQLARLEYLNLAYSKQLTSVGEGFGSLCSLTTLDLRGCSLLETLHPDLGMLTTLKLLILVKCFSLTKLPEELGLLSSLETLDLGECYNLEMLPAHLEMMTSLKRLSLDYCRNLITLPPDFGELSSLELLDLTACTRLERLPANLGKLPLLKQLSLRQCETLKTLPEDLGRLDSLRRLDLFGCKRLKTLPANLRMWTLFTELHLQECESLSALPEDIGQLSSLQECYRLPCLTTIQLSDCNSLSCLPNSFVELKMLRNLKILRCSKFDALPSNFGELSSLEAITIEGCPSLKHLSPGFQSLPNLKLLRLEDCRSLVNLPTGFEKVASLREVHIIECAVLEGAAMDRIVKLPQCYLVRITGSTELAERWKEMESKELIPMIVISDWDDYDVFSFEMGRATRLALLGGPCTELNSTRDELIDSSIMLADKNTTVLFIPIPVRIKEDYPHHLQRIVEVGQERARTASSGLLRIVCLGNLQVDKEEEIERITQILSCLPKESCAIPSYVESFSLFEYMMNLLVPKYFMDDCRRGESVGYCVGDVSLDAEGLHQLCNLRCVR
ncbi:hypothetical protein KI387_037338, partial [Taxus chinensis]